ncbi:hypothetical protein K501DRAFT_278438 [Backusella circina FSU 941]|nr:hypothetical protein K501DRAFT_278438 [Backusella circina FSU 941]
MNLNILCGSKRKNNNNIKDISKSSRLLLYSSEKVYGADARSYHQVAMIRKDKLYRSLINKYHHGHMFRKKGLIILGISGEFESVNYNYLYSWKKILLEVKFLHCVNKLDVTTREYFVFENSQKPERTSDSLFTTKSFCIDRPITSSVANINDFEKSVCPLLCCLILANYPFPLLLAADELRTCCGGFINSSVIG